jgi:hypothetical protein
MDQDARYVADFGKGNIGEIKFLDDGELLSEFNCKFKVNAILLRYHIQN